MRKPSARIITDTVDIYYAIGRAAQNSVNTSNQTGSDGAYQPTYESLPDVADFPCSVQYSEKPERDAGELDRITEIRRYSVLCKTDPLVSPNDMILYVDHSGNQHTLYVEASNDQAGRGSCWLIQATERR